MSALSVLGSTKQSRSQTSSLVGKLVVTKNTCCMGRTYRNQGGVKMRRKEKTMASMLRTCETKLRDRLKEFAPAVQKKERDNIAS